MIGFIIKTPLTHNYISPTLLDLLNHIHEVLLFLFSEFLIVLHVSDVQVVFSLGLGGLEGAGDDGDLCI